jgi:hypothetical protein
MEEVVCVFFASGDVRSTEAGSAGFMGAGVAWRAGLLPVGHPRLDDAGRVTMPSILVPMCSTVHFFQFLKLKMQNATLTVQAAFSK